MSSSQSKFVISGISETSSVSDLVAVLRSSFRKEVFDEVERLLISQRTELQNEIRELRTSQRTKLQNEIRDLREKNKFLQQELKESREELASQVRGTGEVASRKYDQVCRQLKSAYAELEKWKGKKDSYKKTVVQNMYTQLIIVEDEGPSNPSFDLDLDEQDL